MIFKGQLEVPDSTIIEYIKEHYSPEDVFSNDTLLEWAETHDLFKSEPPY